MARMTPIPREMKIVIDGGRDSRYKGVSFIPSEKPTTATTNQKIRLPARRRTAPAMTGNIFSMDSPNIQKNPYWIIPQTFVNLPDKARAGGKSKKRGFMNI